MCNVYIDMYAFADHAVYAYTAHTEARVFVATGTPIQPHSCDGLDGLNVNFAWVVVPPLIFAHVGFPEWIASVDRFCAYYAIDNPCEARLHVLSCCIFVM